MYGRNIFFSTPEIPSLANQEVVSYVFYELPTKKSRSLTAFIIKVAENGNLAAKRTITNEIGYVDYSTTRVEKALP